MLPTLTRQYLSTKLLNSLFMIDTSFPNDFRKKSSISRLQAIVPREMIKLF